jgi:hypothetical protein
VSQGAPKSIHDKNRDETRANGPANSFGQFNSQLLKYVRMADFRGKAVYASEPSAVFSWNRA